MDTAALMNTRKNIDWAHPQIDVCRIKESNGKMVYKSIKMTSQ